MIFHAVATARLEWHKVRIMKPHWRLTVEGFGRIASADVALRRLTLFVGPNNSGKSYLASLLWGLVALQFDLPLAPGPELEAVDARLAALVPDGQARGEASLSPADLALLTRLFDAGLAASRDWLVRRIFNSDLVSARRISFQDVSEARSMRLTWEDAVGENRTHVTVDDGLEPRAGGLHGDVSTNGRRAGLRDILVRRVVFRRLFRLFRGFEDSYASIDPIYLPASRTGFMQLYKAPARRSMRGAFRAADESFADAWLDLTTPAYHFLDLLTFGIRPTRTGDYRAEADLLESGMDGRFELESLRGNGVNEFRYAPAGGGPSLPLKLSSALVTELGPLVLVLRHNRSMPLLVLEEPESHLHPALQLRLAQVVVRLVRKGLCVWITTHSENFCQQLNNFIKLGSLDLERRAAAQQEFGFGEQDFLELDDIAGNELVLGDDGRSTVSEMRRTEAGLVMPAFNREILALSRQVSRLDDLLVGDEEP